MKRKKSILMVAILFLLAAGIYAYREYTRTNKRLSDVRPDVSITAIGLVTEFSNAEPTANQKYLGKVLAVTGAVKKTERDEAGHYTVILGDTASMSSVRCVMDSMSVQDMNRLQRGSQIIIKGNCTGFNRDDLLGSDVILNRCVLAGK